MESGPRGVAYVLAIWETSSIGSALDAGGSVPNHGLLSHARAGSLGQATRVPLSAGHFSITLRASVSGRYLYATAPALATLISNDSGANRVGLAIDAPPQAGLLTFEAGP